MPDFRKMFDAPYVGAWDLDGRDVTLTISRVEAGTITGNSGRTAKKPIVWFEKTEKGLVLNRTNAKTVAALYGKNTDTWAGKRITLFATTTSFGGETVECIRVRPKAPTAATKADLAPSREPGED